MFSWQHSSKQVPHDTSAGNNNVFKQHRDALVHNGALVHLGDPSLIGLSDIDALAFGDHLLIKEGDVLVFQACNVSRNYYVP